MILIKRTFLFQIYYMNLQLFCLENVICGEKDQLNSFPSKILFHIQSIYWHSYTKMTMLLERRQLLFLIIIKIIIFLTAAFSFSSHESINTLEIGVITSWTCMSRNFKAPSIIDTKLNEEGKNRIKWWLNRINLKNNIHIEEKNND